MDCDNRFCIYWSMDRCTLDTISLDVQGNCQACIYVVLDEQILRKEREKIKRYYEFEREQWED